MSHPVCSVAEENSTEETDRRPTLVSSARYSGINCLGFIWEVLGDLNRFRFTGERSTTKSHARLEDSWGEWRLRLVKKPLVEEAITVKVHHRDPALWVYNKVPSIWEEAALWHQHAWLPAEDAYCLLQTRLLTEVEDNSAKCHKTGAALCRWTMSQNRLYHDLYDWISHLISAFVKQLVFSRKAIERSELKWTEIQLYDFDMSEST